VSRLLVAQRALTVPPWVKNELWRRARAVPSLDLRLADNKSLVDAVTGASLVTFTRASAKTVTNSARVLETVGIDVPAFDHNPTTGESLGLLVEEQRTNLVLRSEEFGTTWATFRASVSANATAAPDGNTTADKIVEDTTATNSHGVQQLSLSFTSGLSYTFSVYVKAAERENIRLGLPFTAFTTTLSAQFNLLLGTTTALSAGATATFSTLPNGWVRCTMTAVATATATGTVTLTMGELSTSSTTSYTGDGTSGLFIWGADLEAGAFPTSYIPTTTAAVTRSASLADLISSAIANNIRTLYLEFRSPASGTRGVASLNDNTANERASLLTSGTDPRLIVVDDGVEQANVNGGTVTANQRTRVAVRINANDFAISINGGAVVTDTSGTLPTVDRLMLGRTQAGEYLNGTLARVTGWTQLLPDSTLQSLAQ
jgi:hypothetical protein